MAYAMMGGIIVGTLLTLLFLPALYVAWFRIRPDHDDMQPPHGTEDLADHTLVPVPASSAPAPVLEPQL
jgi:hypothetical protein